PTPTPTEPTEPTRPGAVVPPGGAIPIGSACTASGQCASGAYCQFPEAAACGEGGVAGVCTERPRICQKDCRGACGCDGKRYCNTCQAESLGVSIRHQGNCLEPIVQCGGIAGLRCPDGMTCDYGPPDTIYPDKMGVCVPDGE
ncbi:MAG: hypothetical protein KC635_29550, partial [Myxococcales bacterium]|nr:hypothetical protein [Myxococcales bacterium]